MVGVDNANQDITSLAIMYAYLKNQDASIKDINVHTVSILSPMIKLNINASLRVVNSIHPQVAMSVDSHSQLRKMSVIYLIV